MLADTLQLTKLSHATIIHLYGWQFTAKCQRHFAEREIVSSGGMSLIFFSIRALSPLSNSLYIFPITFPSLCSLQHHRPTSALLSSLLLLRANFAASSHQGQSQCLCVHCDWHCSWVGVCTSWHENCSTVCVLLFTGRADGAEETIYICLALNFLFRSVWLRAMQDSHRCTKTSALL